MASKVLVKMPAVNFNSTSQSQQVVPKKGAELVALGRADNSGAALVLPSMSADPLLRITQLEQNIRFLHEQHQVMLSSLHQEIETLRQRNRDLQFQLVFTKKNAVFAGQQTSSESSPDDDSKSKTLAISPNQQCNTQNLQVEMLEKDISDLRASLGELTQKNNSLTSALDEQAKRLDKAICMEGEYETRLEDASKLIKRLRRENDDQRREMNMLRAQLNSKGSPPTSSSPSSSGLCDGGGGRHGSGGSRRGSGGRGGRDRDRDRENLSGGGINRDNNVNQRDNNSSQQQHGHHRFPPLHTQQYWQRSRQQNNDSCTGGQSSGNASENSPMLPHLQQRHHYNNQQHQPKGNHHNGSGRYYNNGHHHYYNNNHRGNRGGGGSGGNSSGGGGNGGGGNRGGSGNQKQHQQQQQQQHEEQSR